MPGPRRIIRRRNSERRGVSLPGVRPLDSYFKKSNFSEKQRIALRDKFENGEDISSSLGKPIEIRKDPYRKLPNGRMERYADLELVYPNGIKLLLSHTHYTPRPRGRRRYYSRTPKTYLILDASLIIPKEKPGKFTSEKYWVGHKGIKVQVKDKDKAHRSMQRFLRKTLGLNVKYDPVISTPEIEVK